ncbi:MAG: hypothetical protein Q8O67_07810 [Deltaproteobacteria bacterium]|nr:hypothetical protein [Deltaproteobacteria bacterium]
MFKRLNWVVFVLLMVIGAAALLPITGIYSNASCEWTAQSPAVAADKLTPLPSLSLSLRTPDATLGVGLRERLERGLKKGGVVELVDNPHTFPRAQITVTEMDGRWTPFWARLKMKTNVVLDRKKDRKGTDVSVDVVVEGSCKGLVTRDEWQGSGLDTLAEHVIAQILPGT